MGYRHYFYIIPTKVVNKIKDLETKRDYYEYIKTERCLSKEARKSAKFALKDLEKNNDDYLGLWELGKNVFEFGKLYWDDTAEQIQNTGIKLFKDKTELCEQYEESGAYIVGKEAILKAIEIYHNKIKRYFKSLLMSAEELKRDDEYWNGIEDVGERCKQAVEEKLSKWENNWDFKPYNLKENNSSIVSSWLYEYEIFELVHILKTIDFEKYNLIFLGW